MIKQRPGENPGRFSLEKYGLTFFIAFTSALLASASCRLIVVPALIFAAISGLKGFFFYFIEAVAGALRIASAFEVAVLHFLFPIVAGRMLILLPFHVTEFGWFKCQKECAPKP